jgi:ABC-2 type transport system ATP-binding protein
MNTLRPTSGHAEVLGKASMNLAGGDSPQSDMYQRTRTFRTWMSVGDLLCYLRPFYPAWDGQLEIALIQQLKLPLALKLKALSRGARMKAAQLANV